jgi:hypothetical protein
MGLFSLGEKVAEQGGLVDDRTEEEAVFSLLEMPKTAVQQEIEKDGKAKFAGKAILNALTGGLFTPILHPDLMDNKAKYASDLELYQEQQKLGIMDPQVEAYASMFDESDPARAAYIRAANSVKEFDGNDYSLSHGQTRFSGFDDSVVAYNPADPKYTQAQKNLQQWKINNPEPEAGTEAHKQWTAAANQFFNSAVRAGSNLNGTMYDQFGRPVGGSIEPYLENTESQSEADAAGTQLVTSADKMFSEGYTRVRDASSQVRDYDDRIAVAEDTLHKFETKEYDTNMVRGMILNITGLGSMEDAEVRALGTDEAINKVTNFNGHTTDFEYGEAFKAAFADILSGSNVNIGTLTVVIEGLKRGQEQAYQDWRGGVADMVSNAQTPGERLSLERQNTFNKRRYPKAPGLGIKEDGMMYVGGDPGNPDNWLKVK